MKYNIYFDIASYLICLFLTFSVFYKKAYRFNSGRVLISVVIVNSLTAIFDILSVQPFNYAGIQVCNCLYLVLQSFTCMLYFSYLISLAGSWKRIKKNAFMLMAVLAPFVLGVFFIATNPLHNLVFSVQYDSSLNVYQYQREYGLFAIYGMCLYYLIFGIFYVIYYRQFMGGKRIYAITSVVPLILISMAIQYFVSGLLIENIATSIALGLIIVTVERVDLTIDHESGLFGFHAFTIDSKKSAAAREKVSIVVVNVINLFSVRGFVSYEEYVETKKNIAETISRDIAIFIKRSKSYYMHSGEFVSVLYTTDIHKIERAATMIRDDLNKTMTFKKGVYELETNVAVVRLPEDISDSSKFQTFADLFSENQKKYPNVIYYAKESGNKDFIVFTDIDEVINNAIRNNKFELYYQPIYSLKDKKFTSCEALLRLYDERYGFIPPPIFIDRAEKNGCIHAIGDFIIEEVCKFISSDEYKKLGLEYVEVNLSSVQCMSDTLAKRIIDKMNDYDVNPKQINLEITESADLYSYRMIFDNITKLRDYGIKFSLDDYGTGYSNIEKMATLPLNIIKIDRSFVISIDDPKMESAVRHSIGMIKEMGYEIVVEGIETKDLVERFNGYKCDYIQGFYFSKPIPKDKFIQFISNSLNEKAL